MTLLFKYKGFSVYQSSVKVQFGNGEIVSLFEIQNENGNIIHRPSQWGDYCYTKSKAKSIINQFISY
jgi:hypothetical protein